MKKSRYLISYIFVGKGHVKNTLVKETLYFRIHKDCNQNLFVISGHMCNVQHILDRHRNRFQSGRWTSDLGRGRTDESL